MLARGEFLWKHVWTAVMVFLRKCVNFHKHPILPSQQQLVKYSIIVEFWFIEQKQFPECTQWQHRQEQNDEVYGSPMTLGRFA